MNCSDPPRETEQEFASDPGLLRSEAEFDGTTRAGGAPESPLIRGLQPTGLAPIWHHSQPNRRKQDTTHLYVRTPRALTGTNSEPQVSNSANGRKKADSDLQPGGRGFESPRLHHETRFLPAFWPLLTTARTRVLQG
jgi:hypothetical protein